MFIWIIGGSEILAILVMILACIAGGVEVVGQILPLLSVLFIIKSIVQDILYGFLKNHKKFVHVLIFLIIDLARVFIFFYTANICLDTYFSGTGVRFIDGMFGCVFWFITGGFIFIMGELGGILHGMNDKYNIIRFGMDIFFHIVFLLMLILLSAFFYW